MNNEDKSDKEEIENIQKHWEYHKYKIMDNPNHYWFMTFISLIF